MHSINGNNISKSYSVMLKPTNNCDCKQLTLGLKHIEKTRHWHQLVTSSFTVILSPILFPLTMQPNSHSCINKACYQTQEQSAYSLEFKPLMQGFHKWPEHTTISPLGCHLRIYKSLLKDLPPNDPPPDPSPCTYGVDIMQYIYWQLKLALQHTHVLEQWHMVWIWISKKPGNPQIDLNHMLHLFEADYNLLLKWHSSKKFTASTEHHNWLHDSQGTGWLGCSAIDLACFVWLCLYYLNTGCGCQHWCGPLAQEK